MGMEDCTFTTNGESEDEVLRLAYDHHLVAHESSVADMTEEQVKEDLRDGVTQS
jgi:predicted small metal-binding protein